MFFTIFFKIERQNYAKGALMREKRRMEKTLSFDDH
jgi:hypothetical protein